MAETNTMREGVLGLVEELLRETFEGGRPGQGTQYLDHGSGVLPTLAKLTAEQASRSLDGHPSIAAHARHTAFHLRVSKEWILGDHSRRDWKGSFEPQSVTEAEWRALQHELQRSREELLEVLRSLDDETFVSEGAGMGSIAHVAYHLGAIRQIMHRV
jgi:hypothetical protein